MPRGYPIQHTYTDDELRGAVEGARSWRDVERRLGLPHSTATSRKVRASVERLGLSTGFVHGSTRHYREILAAAVAGSHCYSDVVRQLGLPLSGGNHTHISRRIRRLGLDTSHFDPHVHQSRGSRPRRTAEQILAVLPQGKRRENVELLRRALHELGVPEVCSCCGTGPEWQGRFLRLEIDHINGDWRDNRPENLRFLCPNCHAQTDTYCRYVRREES